MTARARRSAGRWLGGDDGGRRDRGEPDRGGQGATHARYTIVMPWFFNGNVRMRLPVARNIALRTAGAATQIVGSPTPPQNPPDPMTIDSTFGICAIFMES